eukprot:4605373-Prymnesium_polylepis.1
MAAAERVAAGMAPEAWDSEAAEAKGRAPRRRTAMRATGGATRSQARGAGRGSRVPSAAVRPAPVADGSGRARAWPSQKGVPRRSVQGSVALSQPRCGPQQMPR